MGNREQEAKQVCMDFNLRNFDAVTPWICTFCDVMCVFRESSFVREPPKRENRRQVTKTRFERKKFVIGFG